MIERSGTGSLSEQNQISRGIAPGDLLENITEEHNRSLPLLYWAGKYKNEVKTVYHNTGNRTVCLYLVHRGSMSLTLNDEVYLAKESYLLFAPPRKAHTLTIDAQSEYATLVFVLAGFVFDDRARVISLHNDKHILRWMEDILELWKERELDREVTGLLLATLLTYIGQLEQRNKAEQLIHPSVLSALKIIEHDLSAPLTIEELARSTHVSPGYLHALFRQQFGCSPLKYRQELRMKMACRLLEQTQLSLENIARQCGYQDVEYFGRVFRKTYRITPTGWRDRRKTERKRLD